MRINRHYLQLPANYLFSTIAAKTRAYQTAHPRQSLIKLSIGDCSRPLPAVVVDAMRNAAAEMGDAKTFRGYGPETGYPWLREALARYYQQTCHVHLAADEIIIGDGAKSDLANLLDIFAARCTVAMCDPVYPVYWESNLMRGRRPKLFKATAKNHFLPLPSRRAKADIIYLCNPANPTGVCYNRQQLTQWVQFALRHKAVIIYDAAYQSFITDPALPRSIYQIAGAEKCAIEVGSFSKMAGFTGVRCGWTIVPQALVCRGVSLNQLWRRRQTAKFNGVSYITQRGAEAVFTPAGLNAIAKDHAYYRRNVQILAATLSAVGLSYVGGENSPYLWVRCPAGQTSWEFFDELLNQAGLVVTAGVGFGAAGEHYVRLTGFNTYQQTLKACQRLHRLYQNGKLIAND